MIDAMDVIDVIWRCEGEKWVILKIRSNKRNTWKVEGRRHINTESIVMRKNKHDDIPEVKKLKGREW